jgi:hypothetical protein
LKAGTPDQERQHEAIAIEKSVAFFFGPLPSWRKSCSTNSDSRRSNTTPIARDAAQIELELIRVARVGGEPAFLADAPVRRIAEGS